MKKLMKIVLIVFAIVLYSWTFSAANKLRSFSFPVYETKIDVTKLPNYHFSFVSHGNSMTEYGIMDDQTVNMYPNKKCGVGDICGIECLSKKCLTAESNIFTKKLVSIENNCYYFEGNKKPWLENGGMRESWDSNKYGCLKDNEFKIWGVVSL